MTAHLCGIDLGKTVFHLIGLSKQGHIKKRFSRKQLLTCTANMPVCLIGMEACAGAHFLARALVAQGHTVKLMPAEYVKPFVKSNKNDYVDVEAIAEAVQRPTMRFVPIKNEAQLDRQAFASRAGSLDRSQNDGDQSTARVSARAWNYCGDGPRAP